MLSSLLSRKGTAKCLESCWDSRRAWFTKRACFAWSSEVMIQFMHIHNLSSAFDVREYVRALQGIDSKVNWDWYCVQKALGGVFDLQISGMSKEWSAQRHSRWLRSLTWEKERAEGSLFPALPSNHKYIVCPLPVVPKWPTNNPKSV